MALTPNSVFHFTKEYNSLLGILKNNFALSYAREKFVYLGEEMEYRIPMVSFCDLKLSDIKNHIENFGFYGIGLNKEWAIENDLNPVWYIPINSNQTFYMRHLLENAISLVPQLKDNGKLFTNTVLVLSIFNYIKNYNGDVERSDGTTIENYRFADEREWRYCLDPIKIIEEKDENGIPLSYIGFGSKMKKSELNNLIKHLKLAFEPNDINYIIVKDEEEIIPLINYIKEVKGSKFTGNDISRLQSRIITAKQIFNDF